MGLLKINILVDGVLAFRFLCHARPIAIKLILLMVIDLKRMEQCPAGWVASSKLALSS